MKGSIALPFIIAIFTIVLMFVFFIQFPFKGSLIKEVKIEQDLDNTQLALLALLSSTESGNSTGELLGNHIKLGEPKNVDFLEEKLNKLVLSKCFELSDSTKTLAKSRDCKPTKYYTKTKIVLPYEPGELVEELKLVVD